MTTRPPLGALSVRATVEQRRTDLRCDIEPGTVVAVLGANGAGKSTLLSLVAGTLSPDAGRITLDGQVLADTSTGVWVPPHRRGIALLAQEPLLFPHMSAATNVEFGPRSRGMPRAQARTEAERWLAAVDAEAFASRRPGELSGGQAQRVAVARALAADPALLLLDEPMAALDVAAAPALRHLLRRVLRDAGRTALLVTHDILDALSLAERVIVLDSGRIVEDGPTRTVLTKPRSLFAARIAGVNLVAGTAEAHGLRTVDGWSMSGQVDSACVPGQSAVAVFGPAAVGVYIASPGGSPRNDLPVTVTELEPLGALVRVHAMSRERAVASTTEEAVTLTADVTAAAVAELDLRPGLHVHFSVKAAEVAVHPSVA